MPTYPAQALQHPNRAPDFCCPADAPCWDFVHCGLAEETKQTHFLLEIDGPTNAPPIALRHVPAGSFVMGSSKGLPHAPEGPQHSMVVKSFWIAETPVTQSQYEGLMKRNPSRFRGEDLPVESLTWLEACKFCAQLGKQSGLPVRLPSEAEWEYACRAGSTTQFHFGDSASELSAYAWFENNSRGQTAPVKQKKPNAWGLYDMTGNVWEWCADVWHEDYVGAPVDGSAWHSSAPSAKQLRYCVRGGAWDMDPHRCRSSYRSFDWEDVGTSRTGFRVVAELVHA